MCYLDIMLDTEQAFPLPPETRPVPNASKSHFQCIPELCINMPVSPLYLNDSRIQMSCEFWITYVRRCHSNQCCFLRVSCSTRMSQMHMREFKLFPVEWLNNSI